MRILEVLLLIIVGVTLISYFFPKRHQAFSYLPLLGLVITPVHLLLEGYRWQMALTYVLVAILALIAGVKLLRKDEGRSHPVIRYILSILGVLVFAGGIYALILFPVIHLPTPTGSLAIGTTFIEFEDTSRLETLTDNPDDTRQFKAQIWYPAEAVSGKPNPYQNPQPDIGSLLADGPPDFVFDYMRLVKTNAYLDAPPLTDTKYPVLFISMGFLSDYDSYQLIAEEMVSQGYVVISLNTPYEWESVVQPDGTVVPYSTEHAQKYEEHGEVILPMWAEFWESDDEERRAEIALEILENESFMDNVLRIRTADIQFVVDDLSQSSHEVAQVMDFSQLGIIGHSMGGAVAGQTCLVDDRFNACVNLDGFQWGDVAESQIDQPFMTIYSEPFEGANNFISDRFTNDLYILTIDGSSHMNFSDTPYVMPFTQQLGIAGEIDPDRMNQITNSYLPAFFGRYLKGEEATLLDSPTYEEVKIISP